MLLVAEELRDPEVTELKAEERLLTDEEDPELDCDSPDDVPLVGTMVSDDRGENERDTVGSVCDGIDIGIDNGGTVVDPAPEVPPATVAARVSVSNTVYTSAPGHDARKIYVLKRLQTEA